MRRLTSGFVLLLVVGCSSPTTTPPPPPPGDTSLRTLLDGMSVGAGGGVLRYTKAGDPLDGLTLTVPAGAYTTTTQWTIVADSAVVVPLPAGFTQVGPALAISNDHQGYAAGPTTLKVPMVVGAGYGVAPFYYNPATRKFEGIPMVDLTATYATLAIENFSTALTTTGGPSQTALRNAAPPTVARCDNLNGFGGICIVWVKVADDLIQGTFTTAFLPGRDDWEFVNYGDYVSPEGDCEGMSVTALFYHFFVEGSSGLYHQYDVSLINKWDNVQGIRFAGSVQGDFDARWRDGFNQVAALNDLAGATASNTDPIKALTSNWLMITFQLTKQPVLMHLLGTAGGHAVIAYAGSMTGKHTVITFADPNFPGTARTMTFDAGVLTPVSLQVNATSTASSFDRAYAVSVTADLPVKSIDARWVEFKRGTAGADRYPSQYSWAMYDYLNTATYITMPAVVQTTFNKFLPALLCPGCSAKIAGITPADRQAVMTFDATGANLVAVNGAGEVTLTPGSTTFVLEATPKSTFSPVLKTGFLDSRSVTVIYTPGTYSLSVTTGPLNVVPGTSSTDILQLNRVNYFSPITITAVSDAGITVTPSETPSPNFATTLTVNMPSSVVLGSTHIVTVTGTAVDLAPVVTTFAVVAVATPAIVLSVQNAPLNIPAGSTSLPDFLNITRTNFGGPITLSGVGDNGITVNVTSQPGTGNVGTFTVTVPNTLPPNTYNVVLTATSSLATKTTSFAVVVQPPSTYTLSVQTAPLNIVAGGATRPDTVLITRTNFTGPVTVSATSDPGITITANPTPTTGNQTILSVSALNSVAAGTYSVLLTGTSGTTVVTTTFAVVVSAASNPVAKVVVTPSPLYLTAGGPTGQYSVQLTDAGGQPTSGSVGWSVDSSAIASIDQQGVVTAFNPGVTAVTAGVGASLFGRALLSVAGVSGVARINVTPFHVLLTTTPGSNTWPFSAVAVNVSGNNFSPALAQTAFTWTSSNTAVATVNGSGNVTAVGTGGAIITAAKDGQQSEGAVSVGSVGAVKGTVVSTSAQYLSKGQATAMQGATQVAQVNINPFTGQFYIPGLAAGSYQIVISVNGYLTQTVNATVTASQTLFLSQVTFP